MLKKSSRLALRLIPILSLAGAVLLLAAWMKPQGKSARQTQTQATPAPVKRPPLVIDKSPSASTEVQREEAAPAGFYAVLEGVLRERGQKLEDVCPKDDPVSRRILEEYGAIFVARDVSKPRVCIFQTEAEVASFQAEARPAAQLIGGTRIELQPPAMQALLAAREEALRQGLNITPRGGSEAARRSFADTKRLWDSRFYPALAYWSGRGRITAEYAAQLRKMPLRQQLAAVFELEKRGIYFSKDFSKSILYSVAAPGSSQHIMMLALDVEQFLDPRVRKILARHGWFQTVKSDLPHFTYLGLDEAELPARGLHAVQSGSQLFWIPNVK